MQEVTYAHTPSITQSEGLLVFSNSVKMPRPVCLFSRERNTGEKSGRFLREAIWKDQVSLAIKNGSHRFVRKVFVEGGFKQEAFCARSKKYFGFDAVIKLGANGYSWTESLHVFPVGFSGCVQVCYLRPIKEGHHFNKPW